MVGSDGSSVEGIWSKLAQARFGLEAAGRVGVLLEVRDDVTGQLVSRQYSETGTTVRDPAVVETLLDLSRFTFAEYEGDLSHAASERDWRSEEHTSELQSLMRISYAVFCLKKKTRKPTATETLRWTRIHRHT